MSYQRVHSMIGTIPCESQMTKISAFLKKTENDVNTVMPPPGDMTEGAAWAGAGQLDVLGSSLTEMERLTGIFCPDGDGNADAMLAQIERLILSASELGLSAFCDIAGACWLYVEKMSLARQQDTKPVEETLVLLKSMLKHMKKGAPFIFDYSDVLALLKGPFEEARASGPPAAASRPEPAPGEPAENRPEKIAHSDLEILADFIPEAGEGLDRIEVNLVDLEQDPSNMDTINEIFRVFHTIKGVSGFLSLTKINRLAHVTENFLDSARSGEFVIEQDATDAILESVDTLKKLLERLKSGISSGVRMPDADIDISILLEHLQMLHTRPVREDKGTAGEIPANQRAMDRSRIGGTVETRKKPPGKKVDDLVKVSTPKLDDLVAYAGELVIAQSMLRQQSIHDRALNQGVARLGQIVTKMQNIAMSMRMIPIKATFMKMIRLVRDLGKKSDKKITLRMSGEETEIDRNVVDALYEPMVHMIRNSVDHGIERESDRLKSGKPVQGSIFLRAYHKGGHIIIEIEDDGRGLDRERILEKAAEIGLIKEGARLTDAQAFDLILEPGFSTARQITDISGRGVGMDVVKERIEKLRGHLSIDSQKNMGTRFTIRLPLTLAIMDGMLVRAENEKYIIPTTAVLKAFKPEPEDYFTVRGQKEMLKSRGELIPLIRLHHIFETGNGRKPFSEYLVVVVVSKEEKRGLLIDELLGKGEYVIKSLGGNLENVEGIAGAAILADGRVGLILDIHGIFTIADGLDTHLTS